MLAVGQPRGSLFSIPVSIIEQLRPSIDRDLGVEQASASATVDARKHIGLASIEESSREADSKEGGDHGLTCLTCGIGSHSQLFSSVEQQRSHFQSDWHRLNLRRRIASQPAMSEEAFEQAIEQPDEVSSISGSNSDSDQKANGHKTAQHAHEALGLCCFLCADGSRIAVWRGLLEPAIQRGTLTQELLLSNLQALHRSPGTWVVILSQGGHFAASVYQCIPAKQGQQPKKDSLAYTAIEHKTFHRYVVRAKAGGRQSGKDATGKHAKSAGSSIRRHNEAMLTREIQDLLLAWQLHLRAASLIFVHAPSANAAPIFNAQPLLLDRHDARVRSVPFTTRRPTFSETQRIMRQLLTVYCVEHHATPAPQPAAETSRPVEQRAPVKDRSAAAKGGQPPEDVDDGTVSPTDSAVRPESPPLVQTDLHEAARSGEVERVKELLESGHDPTAHDSQIHTPYAVAASKAVRDTFRRHMGANPDQWEWVAADVPSALTPELEAHQSAKQAEKKVRQKERERERKRLALLGKAEQEAQVKAAAAAEIELAAAEAAALSVRSKDGEAKVKSKAEKAQLQSQAQREQRAAAAEARMAALREASSQQKLWCRTLLCSMLQ